MAYAIMRIDKIKSTRDMIERYKHNFREYDVANADPMKQDLNMEPIDLNGKTYMEAYEAEMTRLKAEGVHRSRQIRKDAVRGFEVMLSYSHEYNKNIPIEKWVEKNVEWLSKAFNPPENKIAFTTADGEQKEAESDNIKSVVVHLDEVNPHIHAFVVPIDEKGELNAKYYTGGREKFVELQNSYADAMSEFGLSRGKERSPARHQQISRYYEGITRAVEAELPEPLPGESVEDYRERANEVYQVQQIRAHYDLQQVKQEMERMQADARTHEFETGEAQRQEGREMLKLASAIGMDEMTPERIRETRKVVEERQDFEKAKESFPDRKKVEQVEQDYRMIAEWGRKRRRDRQRTDDPERDDI